MVIIEFFKRWRLKAEVAAYIRYQNHLGPIPAEAAVLYRKLEDTQKLAKSWDKVIQKTNPILNEAMSCLAYMLLDRHCPKGDLQKQQVLVGDLLDKIAIARKSSDQYWCTCNCLLDDIDAVISKNALEAEQQTTGVPIS